MKKFIMVVLLMIILVIFSLSVLADNAQPKVTFHSQTPDQVEPGQIVTVKFKIENTGAQSTTDAIVELLPKYPFSLYGDTAKKNIGKLRAGSTGADAVIVEYKLKVDEEAVEGDVELEIKVSLTEGGIIYQDDEFTINIQTYDPVLDITKISMEPRQIAPGGTAELKIFVKNLADSLLKDITFNLDFSGDLPLAPYQTSSQKRIASLQSNHQLPLTFQIIADPNAAAGLHKIPINITYNDERGNSNLIEDILAVLVGDEPDLKIYVKKSTVLQKRKAGTVTIEIANAGTNDIRFLEMEIIPSDDFDLITTSNYIYVGDVDSDDTESEEFEIYVKGGDKTFSLPVRIIYKDANNNEFERQVDLELQLYSSWKLKKFGVLEKSSVGTYLVLIFLGLFGYFYYTRFHKKYGRKEGWGHFKAYAKNLFKKKKKHLGK